MPTDSNDCHLCHIHDHNSPSTLLRTSTLRDHSPPPLRHHRHHHNHHNHHHSHPRSRSGSIDNTYRDHHRHHHQERHKMNRLPSALAKLSEHSVAQSLPASRSNTLRLYPEQVSVLPDGGHRYIGGDRASVHSLELTSPMHAIDNRSHHSLIQTSTLQKPTVTMNPDLLTASLPPLRSHGSQLSLNGHGTLPHPQATPADYFMHRLPFKDNSRKNRFNMQTVLLIGCYTLLFVMAIIIGIVLSYQNGWLGFGSSDTLVLDGKTHVSPSSNSVLGDSSSSNLDVISRNNINGNALDRIQDGTTNNQPPVHNVVQVRNPNVPRANFAGILASGTGGEGRPRSITNAGSDIVRNIPGKRPVPNDHITISQQPGGILDTQPNFSSSNDLNNQHSQPNLGVIQNQHSSHNTNGLNNQQQNGRVIQSIPNSPNVIGLDNQQQNGRVIQNLQRSTDIRGSIPQQRLPNSHGIPLPTLINATPDVPVPFLVANDPRIPSQRPNGIGGTLPRNAITTSTGRIIINAPPLSHRNPFNVFPSNIHNSNSAHGIQRQNLSPTAQNTNVNILPDTNLRFNSQQQNNPLGNINQQINSHSLGNHNQFPPNGNNGASPQINNFNNKQVNRANGGKPVNQNSHFVILENKRPELALKNPLINDNSNLALNAHGQTNLPQKNNDGGVQFNQIHMEKMKMLKEILDSEGSGKLLQDLITLKNNRNSLTTISEHLSEITSQGPNPTIHTSPSPHNIPSKVPPTSLKPQDKVVNNRNQQFPPPFIVGKPSININDGTKQIVPQSQAPPKANIPKSKSNIQVVRELLASLINSPEVQEILASRNKQRSEKQKNGEKEESKSRVKVQGDEMRELLLKALAKEIPSGQLLQNLRLHGPQPSVTRQSAPRNRLAAMRGQKNSKRGKITRAQQLVHFNTSSPARTPSRPAGTLATRVLHNRMGQSASNKKLTSIEHQSVRPPGARRISPKRKQSIVRTSRGRQRPAPNFRLRVKTDGKSAMIADGNGNKNGRRIESASMNIGGEDGSVDGEVVRHWRHMDNDGTVSLGTVRRDGSFAFTNCRPVEMCGNKSINK